MKLMRIHKYLAQSGLSSRRKAEEYIKEGMVFINGEKAQIGQSIAPEIDKVTIGEQIIKKQEEFVYYKLNKPRGVVTTCANIWEKTILDVVDLPQRVFPIGRLDKETTWLILMTNDGRLANYLMHPKYEHEKQYVVETFWPITDAGLERMRLWIYILGRYTKTAWVERIASWKFSITIHEGRNRQIRRMVEAIGGQVKKLKRIRIENIELGSLQDGEYKHLSKKELDDLFKILGINQTFEMLEER